jgi:hypothetical protein
MYGALVLDTSSRPVSRLMSKKKKSDPISQTWILCYSDNERTEYTIRQTYNGSKIIREEK